MAKEEKYEARVDLDAKERMVTLDAKINLMLLPKKTTKGERIELAQKALVEKLEGGKA